MSIARIIATLAVAALLPAAAARAEFNAGSETVAAGAVSATLSWDRGEVGPANMTLTISRGGAVAFRQAIPRACGAPCQRFAGDGDDFRLTELDGDGEPEVLVASSNLEECCETIGIYGFQAAAGTYDELVRTFEIDPDIEDLDRDGRSELVTRDLRFRDLVGGDFGAWLPPVVLVYERRGGAPRARGRHPVLPGPDPPGRGGRQAVLQIAAAPLDAGRERRRRLRGRSVPPRPRLRRAAGAGPPGRARDPRRARGGQGLPPAGCSRSCVGSATGEPSAGSDMKLGLHY